MANPGSQLLRQLRLAKEEAFSSGDKGRFKSNFYGAFHVSCVVDIHKDKVRSLLS